jgi:hypothetical protein
VLFPALRLFLLKDATNHPNIRRKKKMLIEREGEEKKQRGSWRQRWTWKSIDISWSDCWKGRHCNYFWIYRGVEGMNATRKSQLVLLSRYWGVL